jgi:DNA replication ATP-dependent helicase Dna2
MTPPPFVVSPSKLARYFYHNCERQLQCALASEEHLAGFGAMLPEQESNPVVELLQDAGYGWEERVVAHHLSGAVKLAEGEGPLSSRVFSVSDTLRQLAELSEGEWLYQATLRPPDDFPQSYGLDPRLVRFSACRPDLLWVHDGKIRVVDVKASDALRASHRVQVALYVLLLERTLRSVETALEVDREHAYVWLYETEEPKPFPLQATVSILEGFLRQDLGRILNTPFEQAFWHLTPRCEWCELFAHCREQAVTELNVSLVPFLTHGARRFLKNELEVDTVDGFGKLLAAADADQKLRGCGSLFGRAWRFRNATTALLTQRLTPHDGSSLRLPIHEDVRIVLSAQKEPVSGRCYLAAFQRSGGDEVYGDAVNICIELASSASDCDRVRKALLHSLFQELYQLHSYNCSRPWEEQKSLQMYCFDGYEVSLIETLLFRHLEDPETTDEAQILMLYFQNEQLAQSLIHPVQQVAHPLVNLVELLRELVSLPLPLMVHLQRLSQSFPNLHPGAVMEPDDEFHYQLNNAMRAGPILAAWEEAGRERVDGITGTSFQRLEGSTTGETSQRLDVITIEMSKRLVTAAAVVDAVRKTVPERLFAWARKFVFPNYTHFHHQRLSRLEFVLRYESFIRALETRERRAKPLSERLLNGTTVRLVKDEAADSWSVPSRLEAASFDDGGGHWGFLLAPTCLQGERAQMAWDDYRRRNHQHVQAGLLRLARVSSVVVDPGSGCVTSLRLELKGHKDHDAIVIGEKFYLHPRYSDFISERQAKRLREEDDLPGSLLLGLLDQPQPLGEALPPLAHPTMAPDGLTSSQQNAWKSLCRGRLTLVWGPPGTGKTHFLAAAIGALARRDQPLRVAVTAFTHSAVENLLVKLAGHAPELRVAKLGELKKPSTAVRAVEPVDVCYQPTGTVVGGTVYGIEKAMKARMPKVDVLVVDEGSQLKWGELALALPALKPGGRLILAGDDLQLPPIIAGRYPEPDDGLPGLEDSCFAYLRARDNPEAPFTCQLTENWRMHQTLSDFAAETLYGPEYQPATTAIAGRAFPLRAAEGNWLDPILDPGFPLVLCVLEDVQACQENLVEAGLVSDLALQIRQRLLRECDDEQFWRDELFIVSPHHLQIRAILAELRKGRQWTSPPFVDTVDKMQGQEARAVIVSYGVSDTETALQEASFIYSLNRLNVAITRAQAKCIVFLPRPLLQPRFEVLEDEKAAAGLGHMNALLSFCLHRGEELRLSGGPKMTVWRA